MHLSFPVTPPGSALAGERYINRRDIHPPGALSRLGTHQSVRGGGDHGTRWGAGDGAGGRDKVLFCLYGEAGKTYLRRKSSRGCSAREEGSRRAV